MSLSFEIEWHDGAAKDFRKLPRNAQVDIAAFLNEDLQGITDPRDRAKPLAGALKGLWRFRVGQYRLICDIEEQDGLLVLIIMIAHRSKVYSTKNTKTTRKRT